MKGKLLAINHAVILWGSTLYAGMLWALHFFWFPSWQHLTVANDYDQFITQTLAATHFFTYWVPTTYLCLCVMVWSERMEHWIQLNNIRWITETLAWLVFVCYFIAKGRIPARIEEDLA